MIINSRWDIVDSNWLFCSIYFPFLDVSLIKFIILARLDMHVIMSHQIGLKSRLLSGSFKSGPSLCHAGVPLKMQQKQTPYPLISVNSICSVVSNCQ